VATAAALAWLYLLTVHGGYWRTSVRLPPAGEGAAAPVITAVIPARNEAGILPDCLPSLLSQDYAGTFGVIVVDDDSTDGTAAAAAAAGTAAGWRVTRCTAGGGPAAAENRVLSIVAARPTPPGWAGKVWAMSEGVIALPPDTGYVLFTDADIAYRPGTVAALASGAAGSAGPGYRADGQAAATRPFTLVSQMALLRTGSPWERLLIPAFVYFFAQLYPFARVGRPRSRTAAAAGGCMLVSAGDLAAAGGLERIRSARIDDVALGSLLKRAGGRCWLGVTTDVVSLRPYDRLADIWDMVARSAYTQLRYSLAATAGAVIGLAWLYLLPPAAAVSGLVLLGAGAPQGSALWLAVAGLAGWLLMSVTYLPILRLYRLSPARAPALPLIAAMYAAMTADSARRHFRGRGGEWKGRLIEAAPDQPAAR
jgi:hopene-associated glycosyltransferase HpnB